MEQHDHFKHLLDFAALSAAVAGFLNNLPVIALLLSAVWTLLRIVEMFAGKSIAQLIRRK
jgi:hypothetical protein